MAVYDADNDYGENGTIHFYKVRPKFLKDGKLESDSHSFFEHVEQVVKRHHTPEEAKIVAAVLQAEQPRATPIATAPKVKITPEKQKPENAFLKNGDVWEIRYKGKTLNHIRNLDGLTYIHALLKESPRDVSALDLYEIANPPPSNNLDAAKGEREQCGTGGSKQHVIDGKATKAIKRRLRECQATLCDSASSEIEKTEAEQEIAAIGKELIKTRISPDTGGTTFQAPERERARITVSHSIDRAFAALAKQSKDLSSHLSKTIQKGASLHYCGESHWET